MIGLCQCKMQHEPVLVRSGVSLHRSGSEWSWKCQYCGSKGAGRNVNRHIKTAEHQKRLSLIEYQEFDNGVRSEIEEIDGKDKDQSDQSWYAREFASYRCCDS